MSFKIPILYIGATGYIGGSALQAILAHPKANTFEITALVRSEAKAKVLESALGIKTVIGSIQDHAFLTENVEKADVVIQQANADDMEVTKAVLAGLKRKFEKTGKKPILIHTSGTGILIDNARGEYASPTITSDLDAAAIEKISAIYRHAVDLLVSSADVEGYATTYIVVPGIVYGRPKGPLFDGAEPIANTQTVVVPRYTEAIAQRGRPGIVGKGANIWAYVHVDDNADAYVRVLDAALYDPARISHGREGFFFVESSEHSAYELVKLIAEALVELGVITDAEPDVYTAEERLKYFGSEVIVSIFFANARCTADRIRKELGWAPKHTTEDFVQHIKEDVEVALKKLKAQ
ncbi:NAD(P)-binding protein [Dichomitus squalens LYAD-421 SS1]|uniref:NAD(P)-binding protein n=1 Tax=Dichomitus squalens (strain LYAD-421) TaxID=732165 RepID=UPI0004414D65|nr:NAD(P)-binding protein [Dichomitus squalens LYAD-421 SS1]EJF64709.1 NAD(P)-binding protein [Dichomitus squalens LYAD-421 SS1]